MRAEPQAITGTLIDEVVVIVPGSNKRKIINIYLTDEGWVVGIDADKLLEQDSEIITNPFDESRQVELVEE